MRQLELGLLFFMMTIPAMAAGNHAGGHGDHPGGHGKKLAVGEPGQISAVSKTVEVRMMETDDGRMIFTPNNFQFDAGQTVRFAIRNDGAIDHEFVLDDERNILEHKAIMEDNPDLAHDDPNAVRLQPGQTGEIVWSFSNEGVFKVACLLPGHYDAGMYGDVVVSRQ
jgi:uncharacterized cupredoxin-like copper-binding protein